MQEESPEGGRFKKEISVDGHSHLLLIRDEGGSPELQVSYINYRHKYFITYILYTTVLYANIRIARHFFVELKSIFIDIITVYIYIRSKEVLPA